jgi:predicted amidohydrolase YtcJ
MIKKTFLYLLISFLISIIFITCAGKKKVDKVFYNGRVYTVDNNFSVVDAFAVNRGFIKEIGPTEDILSGYDAKEIIDLKGASVFPGFIDAHCHFYGYSTDLLKCDLNKSISFDDVLNRLQDYASKNKFSWILGRGWDQNDWEDKSWPGNEKLDSLFPDKPVLLMRVDGHAALCNSKALSLAGITSSTNITGGEIILKNGKLTGLLIDNAVDLVQKNIPVFSEELIEEALLKGQQNCFSVGLTTVDDAGLGKDTIFKLINLQKKGLLKLRIYAMISDNTENLEYFKKHGPYKSDRMNVNAIKVYADGALGSRGACMKKEYSDQKGHFGYMLCTVNHLEKIAGFALENGFQLCTHAIGDSANKVVLNVYEDHLSTENHRRWRIEHCQIMEPNDRKKLNDYSIIPSVQPTHATSDMYWAEDRIGKKRMAYAYAYEDLKDASDNTIVFGTDFPVEDINPVYTFYAAVARKDLKGFPPGGFQVENKMKRKDALKAMTLSAAYSNFEEEEKGSLEEGKVADFVILDSDIMEIKEEEIPKTKVVATYLAGEKVWGKNDK